MELTRKSVTFALKANDDATRTVEGYASTFGNIDSQGDIILPGAFTDSLKSYTPKMLSQHDTGCVIGIWTSFSENQNGLYVKGQFANTTDGNDMYELVKLGAIDSMSIGYSAIEADYGDNGIRTLKQVKLWEVSLVTFPANEQAKVTGVKNADGTLMTERQFEEFLRDVGELSQKEAKVVLSTGYRALLKQKHRDGGADEELNRLHDILNQLTP